MLMGEWYSPRAVFKGVCCKVTATVCSMKGSSKCRLEQIAST